MKLGLIQSELIATSKLLLNSGQLAASLGIPKNPRFIKDDRYAALRDSLIEHPDMLSLREVIVYQTETGKLIVLGGNMRLRACRELKIKEIPVKILPSDTPAQYLRAIIIKDNVGFGEHDWELLGNEWDLEELVSFGMVVDFGEEDKDEQGDKEPEEKNNIVLDYPEQECKIIKAALLKVAHTPEAAVAELLFQKGLIEEMF